MPQPRATRQRQAVADLLRERSDFRSAQQLHAELRERGSSVGLATVYRNLALLAQAGDLDTLQREDGELLYRQCSSRHHHHLVCRRCGRTVEVAGPAVEQWADRVAAEHGFSEVSHTLELFGTCAECAAAGGGGWRRRPSRGRLTVMAYDAELADRLLRATAHLPEITTRKMFGGLAVMWRGNMLAGVIGEDLMVRVGADAYAEALAQPGATTMEFTGRPM
jgi:Fur family ferric uptake transcriptional regulator